MHSEVAVTSAVVSQPVVLRTLLANNNSITQISSRLADSLGLDAFRDVYVKDVLFDTRFQMEDSAVPREDALQHSLEQSR